MVLWAALVQVVVDNLKVKVKMFENLVRLKTFAATFKTLNRIVRDAFQDLADTPAMEGCMGSKNQVDFDIWELEGACPGGGGGMM